MLALLAPLALTLVAQDPTGTPAADGVRAPLTAVDAALLERVVVLGASVSDGAGLASELEVVTPLATFVDAFRAGAGEPALDLGNFWFFARPVELGASSVQEALAARPTLVVALDFLFWYGFGDGLSDAERPARLEQGLAELERFDCPVLVGDFPDVAFALDGYSPLVQGPLIFPNMLPAEPVRARLNARIGEWAASRAHVTVAPLAEFVRASHAGEAIAIRGARWPEQSFEELIQSDKLHPTVEGSIALLTLAFDALERAREDLPAAALRWDPAAVRAHVMELTEEGRAKARARSERRAGLRDRLRKKREEAGGGGR